MNNTKHTKHYCRYTYGLDVRGTWIMGRLHKLILGQVTLYHVDSERSIKRLTRRV